MEKLTFTKIENTATQRYYRLSNPITRSAEGENLEEEVSCVCISDSWMHRERLVFRAKEYESGAQISNWGEIGGVMTNFMNGGDPDSIQPDYYYLEELAEANGFEMGGVV